MPVFFDCFSLGTPQERKAKRLARALQLKGVDRRFALVIAKKRTRNERKTKTK